MITVDRRVLVDVNSQRAWTKVAGKKIYADLDTFAPDLRASGYAKPEFEEMTTDFLDSVVEDISFHD